MCQVMEVLAFCHQNAKIIHANLNPQNIYLTPKGHWKISGFHFSICHPTTTGFTPIPKLIGNNDFIPFLDYVAPEYALESHLSNESDVFSFAMTYAQLLVAHYTNKSESILNTYQARDTYVTRMNSLATILDDKLSFLYNETLAAGSIIESIKRATLPNHKERTTSQFILNNCELLFGEEVKALRFLSNMNMREPVKKATFLQSLLPMLKQKKLNDNTNTSTEDDSDDGDFLIPTRTVLQKVLPPLLNECKDVKMCLFALPNILAICTRISQAQFSQLVLPTVQKNCLVLPLPDLPQKPISAAPQVSPKVPLMVLRHLNILWSKTTEAEQKSYIVPFLLQALQYHANADIQMEAMKRSEEGLNSHLIESNTFKTMFLPPIRDVCERTNSELVRTNAIVCVGKSLEELDSTTIVNHVLPMVENALVKNPRHASAPLLMSCVGVMRKISELLVPGKSSGDGFGNHQFLIVMASRVLPAVLPVATQRALNSSQFKKYMKAVRSMMDKIEAARAQEFEETNKQYPLLSQANTHSEPFEDDDPTIADEMTEDPFQNSVIERLPSVSSVKSSFTPATSSTARKIIDTAPPTQTSPQPEPQPTIVQRPVAPPAEVQLPTHSNNPIHKLLTETPVPQKKQNIFFQGGDEDDLDETADTNVDSEEAEAIRRDKEMERLSMLIDRAEQNHEFDNLLNRIDDAPDLAPLNTPADDFGYNYGMESTTHAVTSNNVTDQILYPDRGGAMMRDDHYSSPSQQQQQQPQQVQQQQPAPEVTQSDDHFDRLLNQYNGTGSQASTGGLYSSTTNDFWGTPSNAAPTGNTRQNSGASFDFDSLLNRHLSDDE